MRRVIQALPQLAFEFVDLHRWEARPSWRRPPRCPHSGQRLRSPPLLRRHARGETLPVSGRRDRVAVEHDPLHGEFHLLGPGLGEAGADALPDHGSDSADIQLAEAGLGPDPFRMQRLERLARHEVHVEDPAKRLRIVRPRPVGRADRMQEHIARVHRERDRVGPAEQLLLREPLHLNVTRQVVAGEPVQAAVLDRRLVEVDVAVEVGNPERVRQPVRSLVGRILVPADRHAGAGQLHDERVVDRHERVTQALAHRREQPWVHRRHPERGVAVPQDPVGAIVVPAAIDLPVAVAHPPAGDRLRRHLVGRPLQRPNLVPVEHATDHQQAVAMEPVDLLVGQHPLSPYPIPTWSRG